MEEPIFSQQTVQSGRNTDPARLDNSIEEATSLWRVSTVLAVTVISLWANYEASKGFDITVVEVHGATFAARHYNLMFVSNGGAARAILNASASIERALYPDVEFFPIKPIKSVTLRVADYNLTRAVIVTAVPGGGGDYVIHVSPNVIEERDADKAVVAAVYMGMARVWVRDGRGMAPAAVVDAVVGYIFGAAGFGGEVGAANVTFEGCGVAAVGFVEYCEERRPGFAARLNREMEKGWEDGMLEKALGTSVRVMCAGFRSGLDWVLKQVENSTEMVAELQLG